MYKVYYTGADDSANAMSFDSTRMTDALNAVQDLRKMGLTFVTMVCENTDHVGQMGVTTVENGRLPDGTDYDWRKRR